MAATEFELLKKDYICGLKAQRDTLFNQFQNADMKGFAQSVHMIKGTAGMFDCKLLYQQAVELDRLLKSDSVTFDSQRVQALLTAIDEILVEETPKSLDTFKKSFKRVFFIVQFPCSYPKGKR